MILRKSNHIIITIIQTPCGVFWPLVFDQDSPKDLPSAILLPVLVYAPNLLLYIFRFFIVLYCFFLILLYCIFGVQFYVRRLLSHMNYHQIVSINRPLGYGPNALPLRHDDYMCPKAFSLSIAHIRRNHLYIVFIWFISYHTINLLEWFLFAVSIPYRILWVS